MRLVAACLLTMTCFQPALAHSEADVFRPVSFICSSSSSGTATKTVENILGQRISYRVSYVDDVAMLFVISRARHGTNFKAVRLIDLGSEHRVANLKTADIITIDMARDRKKYCEGNPRQQQAAREELLTNHQFNQAHPRYRGK